MGIIFLSFGENFGKATRVLGAFRRLCSAASLKLGQFERCGFSDAAHLRHGAPLILAQQTASVKVSWLKPRKTKQNKTKHIHFCDESYQDVHLARGSKPTEGSGELGIGHAACVLL